MSDYQTHSVSSSVTPYHRVLDAEATAVVLVFVRVTNDAYIRRTRFRLWLTAYTRHDVLDFLFHVALLAGLRHVADHIHHLLGSGLALAALQLLQKVDLRLDLLFLTEQLKLVLLIVLVFGSVHHIAIAILHVLRELVDWEHLSALLAEQIGRHVGIVAGVVVVEGVALGRLVAVEAEEAPRVGRSRNERALVQTCDRS